MLMAMFFKVWVRATFTAKAEGRGLPLRPKGTPAVASVPAGGAYFGLLAGSPLAPCKTPPRTRERHFPWQRGSNENTNGLPRQYFPRGTDLSRFSQAYLNKIASRLNQRPRKTLGLETPADRLRAVLQ